jgi:CheY-like chemotaxis protein
MNDGETIHSLLHLHSILIISLLHFFHTFIAPLLYPSYTLIIRLLGIIAVEKVKTRKLSADFEKTQYDAILMDFTMPNMDGPTGKICLHKNVSKTYVRICMYAYTFI